MIYLREWNMNYALNSSPPSGVGWGREKEQDLLTFAL